MRCPECKEGDMKLSLYIRPKYRKEKDKGILKCNNCEYEVKYL